MGANNFTRAEILGRKEIAEGVKSRNWMLYGTDKSGPLVAGKLGPNAPLANIIARILRQVMVMNSTL